MEKEITDRLREITEKEIEKMKKVREKLKVVKDDRGLLKLIDSYLQDSSFFLKKSKLIEAFEAIVIVWSYTDAGLRFGIFELPQEFKKYFTV